MNLLQHVLGQLSEIIIVRDRHVALGNCDNLIVLLTLVYHPHDSDDFGFKQAERLNSDGAEDEDIQRIIILTVSLRDETVVCWVVNCTEQYSIESQQPAILIKFIFDLALSGDLNDGIHNLRTMLSVRNIMPWIFSVVLLGLFDHPTTISNQILNYMIILLISNHIYSSRTNMIRTAQKIKTHFAF